MADDGEKEVRAQRHDFIKEYYKMATSDLDRHLKAGWQTIAVLAGGAAILTAGHDGKIGLPIAVTMALVSALWGVLSVIDANYWSIRAIAFLSNVEAVYFSAKDREFFNPYVGYHPPFKLLDSLRYMFWLCVVFGFVALLSLVWEIARTYPTVSLIYTHIKTMQPLQRVLWSLPLLAAVWGVAWVGKVYSKRMEDYYEFSRNSPGPGVRSSITPLRYVTLEPVDVNTTLDIDKNTNARLQEKLRKDIPRWNIAAWCSLFLAGVFTVVVGLCVIS